MNFGLLLHQKWIFMVISQAHKGVMMVIFDPVLQCYGDWRSWIHLRGHFRLQQYYITTLDIGFEGFDQNSLAHNPITITLFKNSFTHGRRTGPFFSKFYTVRYSQRWFYYHLKFFKKWEFSQNLKVVAQKQHPPRPF